MSKRIVIHLPEAAHVECKADAAGNLAVSYEISREDDGSHIKVTMEETPDFGVHFEVEL